MEVEISYDYPEDDLTLKNVKITCVKPDWSISTLSEKTTGIEPMFSAGYKRKSICDHCDDTGVVWEPCHCYECEYEDKHGGYIWCLNCQQDEIDLQKARQIASEIDIENVKRELMVRASSECEWTHWDTALAERLDKEMPGYINTNNRLRK